MSLKVFGSRFKSRQSAPQQQTAPQSGSAEVAPVGLQVSMEELQAQAREMQILKAQAEAAKREAEEAKRLMAQAAAERDQTAMKNAVIAEAAKAGAKNPEHVWALKSSEFILHNGKVVSKSDPSKDVTASLGEFFQADGKYMLGAVVPGGGAGVSSTVTPPAPRAPLDLKSKEGLTAVTRGLTHKMFGLKEDTRSQGAPSAPPVPQGPPPQK